MDQQFANEHQRQQRLQRPPQLLVITEANKVNNDYNDDDKRANISQFVSISDSSRDSFSAKETTTNSINNFDIDNFEEEEQQKQHNGIVINQPFCNVCSKRLLCLAAIVCVRFS